MKFDLALVLMIVAMLWGAIGVRLVEERQTLETGARQSASNIAGAAEQGIARTIEAIDQRLRFAREAYRRDPAGFTLDFVASGSGYEDGMMMQLALIDASGKLRQTNLGPTDGTLDLSDRPHFRVHLGETADTLYISEPVLGRVSQRWSVQFTRKIHGPDGQFAGVVVCSLDPYWLTQFHELLDISGNMLLVGQDGVVRASAPDTAVVGQNLSNLPLGRAAAAADHGSFHLRATAEMPERIVSFRRLRSYPVTVAVGVDAGPIFAEYRQARLATVAIGLGLTLMVLVAGALLIRHKRRVLTSRAVLRNAVENLEQGLVMVDRHGRILLCNSRYVTMLGLPPERVKPGAAFADLIRWQAEHGEFSLQDAEKTLEELIGTLSQGDDPSLRFKERVRPDGTTLEIRIRLLPDGGIVATFTDITARRRAEREIHHLAHHDGLTDLANRTLLEERLTQALVAAERSGEAVAVLCLDLDRFKPVNDTLGHAAGDELLRQTARRLRGVARASDVVARVGGDEFVLVQTGVTGPADVAALAERIMADVSLPYDLEGHQASVDTSVGVALFPHDGTTVETLLKNADTALYRAKEAGRGIVCFFEPAMEARLRERGQMEQDLRRALAQGEFSLDFQALHACGTRDVTAFEALLRWTHPERGPIPPAEFIPVAEECGLILPLGRWVLEQACTAAAAWPQPYTVSVNLSPAQFHRGNLPALVAEVLSLTGLPAHHLELEVTESLLIEDTESALTVMRALKALGVQLSLDDFGTGYSSLSYLRHFPFDKLKIDKSFTQAIEVDPGARAIVDAILAMGHSLNLRVTAEGVETERQLAFLSSHDCDEVQGFLLGAPVPAAELRHSFQSRPRLAAG